MLCPGDNFTLSYVCIWDWSAVFIMWCVWTSVYFQIRGVMISIKFYLYAKVCAHEKSEHTCPVRECVVVSSCVYTHVYIQLGSSQYTHTHLRWCVRVCVCMHRRTHSSIFRQKHTPHTTYNPSSPFTIHGVHGDVAGLAANLFTHPSI